MGKIIVLTGGGTAGHVTPNLALVPRLLEEGYKIVYIGSYNGIEEKLIKDANIEYYPISSGKLRREFNFKNFTDGFRVIKGLFQAKKLLKKIKPDIVFSKGGFVTVPVVFAAKSIGIPVVIHESDLTPGLANRLSIPKAKKVCCNFKRTLQYLPKEKSVLTGLPIRSELYKGNKEKGYNFVGFRNDKPILMVMGGSLGALSINRLIHNNIDDLLLNYNIIHLTGIGKLESSLVNKKNYIQFEYVNEEMADLLSIADIVISRAGANAICELLSLQKLNILIPLSKAASRGDQILNAKEFVEEGYSCMIEEENLNKDTLKNALEEVLLNKGIYINNMKSSGANDAINTLIDIFNEVI